MIKKNFKKIFWLDLEMSGLEVSKDVIIEIAAVISNFNLECIDEYHSVVYQPPGKLINMDDWNKKHHTQSGLIDKIPFGKKINIVENELIDIISKYYKKNEKVIIAGNSIYQDRLFINKYLKKFAAFLHYRMLDVSAWKILMKDKFNIHYKKKNKHRAIDDIKESIEELKIYLGYIKIKD